MSLKGQQSSKEWDKQLSKLAKQLNRYQPSEELWDKIEARLALEVNKFTETERNRIHWLKRVSKLSRYFRDPDAQWNRIKIELTAVATFIFILISAYFFHQQRVFVNDENYAVFLTQLDQDIEQTEQQYRKIIKRLSKIAQQNEQNVEPQLLALYNEKLILVDESIRACNKALRENPRNPVVQMVLFDSYRQKVATLKLIAQTNSENKIKEVL